MTIYKVLKSQLKMLPNQFVLGCSFSCYSMLDVSYFNAVTIDFVADIFLPLSTLPGSLIEVILFICTINFLGSAFLEI